MYLKWKISIIKGRKHCEKRRNCLFHRTIVTFNKLKQIADILKCILNKKEVPFRVENVARKGILLVTSNFSFSHNVFHSYISSVRQIAALCGNGLTTQSQVLTTPKERAFEKTGKRRNVRNQHFLLCTQCFLPYHQQKFIILETFVIYKCFQI